MKKIIFRLLVVFVFLLVLTVFIAYARGYRLDLEKNSFTPTGIISVNSYPKAAKIYLNGELKGVTDQNLSLPPGKYEVEIKKDGFTSWKKTFILKGELVESANALLFPINPSLSPLTNLGIIKIFPMDQSGKFLLFSENDLPEKDGIYVFDIGKSFSFLAPLKLIALKSSLPTQLDFSKTNADFSPDQKQAIITFETENNPLSYLLSLEEENKQLFEVTLSKKALLTAWQEEKNQEIAKLLEGFPKDFQKVASDSFKIISFSPDKEKVLYQTKTDLELPIIIKPRLIATNQTLESRNLKTESLYIYDQKEDKNFKINLESKILNSQSILNSEFLILNSILWYPDSEHLVVNEGDKIVMIEYDDQNHQTVYSGPYEKEFIGVATDGKLLILTNLNSQSNKLPDIYAVGIK